MFESSLMEYGAVRLPVLKRFHWAVSAVIGAAFFAAAWLVLPFLSGAAGGALRFQAFFVGILTASWSLMAFYVWMDSRRENLSFLWAGTALFHLPGFVVYLIYSATKTGDWKRASVPMAYALQGLLLGALIAYPLIKMEAVQKAFIIVDPAPPIRLGTPAPSNPGPRKRFERKFDVAQLYEMPKEIPENLEFVEDDLLMEEPGSDFIRGGPGDGPPGHRDGIFGGADPSSEQPPLPPEVFPSRPIRVGGQVQSAKLISSPRPVYPLMAKLVRVEGTVRLRAIVSRSGMIKDLQVLGGHHLLVKAALDAVQRWRYQPTLLNGEPVEVDTIVEIKFSLVR